ncbi:glycosyltransferase [Pedobacter polaris]|uniref:Glycosyltransferase n=1 Tax=Pedobacter polaris TaxID=2571273 RepID=A0A4V5P2F7_9SPHI|nr:glycosyltransferase [Pedobacter polaris]TKC08185.1 glycosyltransferase [Pedobacter polaris]
MKLLFILPEYYPHSGGGISTYYIQYIKKIAPFCEHVKVILGSGYFQGTSGFETDNIKSEDLDPNLFSEYLSQFQHLKLSPAYQRNLAAAWAMWDQSNGGEGYDIIECTDFGLGYIPWLINHTKPVITRLHGSSGQIELHQPELNDKLNGDLNRQTELLMLSRCDQLVTHSEQNCEFWKKLLPNKEVTYILPIYEAPTEFNHIKKEDFGIVCARIQQWKGPEQLSKAMELIPDFNIPIHWYGRDMDYSPKISKSTYLKNKYPTIWGQKIVPQNVLPNEKIKLKQAAAKFAVIPSTWDMFNFTFLEYLSVGTPIICSDGAGSSTLINHGVNGFKYPANDPKELANCLETIANLDDVAYEKLINEGYKTMNTTLNCEFLIEKNLNLYQQILLNFNPPVSNIYLEQIYKPNNSLLPEVLDVLPLKYIFNHMINRLKKKLNTKF